MPCPHCDIRIVQRSENESAAYQSGEKLFSEYDQKQKYYSHKREIVHKEIMLPPHASPEYADRNTLWNAAEAVEKQWNSQFARRVILAIPRELSPEHNSIHQRLAAAKAQEPIMLGNDLSGKERFRPARGVSAAASVGA